MPETMVKVTQRRLLDLEQTAEGLRWCLDEVADQLDGYACRHGRHNKPGTPPMMYREWVHCVVQHAALTGMANFTPEGLPAGGARSWKRGIWA